MSRAKGLMLYNHFNDGPVFVLVLRPTLNISCSKIKSCFLHVTRKEKTKLLRAHVKDSEKRKRMIHAQVLLTEMHTPPPKISPNVSSTLSAAPTRGMSLILQ